MAQAISRDATIEELTEEERDVIAHFRNPVMPSVASTADAATKIASARGDFAQTDVYLEMVGFDQADVRRIKAQEQRTRGLRLMEQARMYNINKSKDIQLAVSAGERFQERKRTGYAKKRNLLLEASNPYKNPKTSLKVDQLAQSKHVIGGHRYNEYIKTHEYPPSYLTITEDEIRYLIEKYHGTGILKLNKKGELIPSDMIVGNEKK